jgi:Lrp/AsnC family transcriptional regulator, regulator for asnA, asnC and gidA
MVTGERLGSEADDLVIASAQLLRIHLLNRAKCCTIRSMAVSRRRSGRQQLDDTSKAIVEQLQQDGRRPYASIGKAVGLSEAAVRQRVQKLIESGAVQIVAVADPQQIGFARQMMIGINIEGDLESAATALAEIPELVYVVLTAGSFDILAEAVVIDDDHLLELINERIRKLAGVRRTETFMYLKLKKQTYNWGIA